MNPTIGPRSAFQARYLNSDADIIIAGGAAGSSKSYVGLMRHLRWVDDPRYRGFCIRKNSTAIMKEGGLFDEAVHLYTEAYGKQLKIKLKDQKLVFPSGASVSFTHYENDAAGNTFQGLQLSSAFYDEATHASEKHIWWLISRLRSQAKMKPNIWLTCNPEPDTWLRQYVDWWLYPEGHEKAGLSDPEKNGKPRFLLRINGELIWSDTYEEIFEKYKKRTLPDDHPEQIKPKKVEVHLGTIRDNPTLMKTNPEYLSNLEALPEIEKQRLLLGNWNVRESASGYFKREWVKEVPYINPEDIKATVRTFDFAMTLKSDTTPSPDYTATILMHKLKNGEYAIADIKRNRILSGDWISFILEMSKNDPANTEYYIPLDPGPMAKKAHILLKRDLAELGLYVKSIDTNKSKLDRFRPFSSFAQPVGSDPHGGVLIVKGCADCIENGITADNNFFYKELETFTGERKRGESGHDDLVDCVSDAFYALAVKKHLPNFSKTLNVAMGQMKVNPGIF